MIFTVWGSRGPLVQPGWTLDRATSSRARRLRSTTASNRSRQTASSSTPPVGSLMWTVNRALRNRSPQWHGSSGVGPSAGRWVRRRRGVRCRRRLARLSQRRLRVHRACSPFRSRRR